MAAPYQINTNDIIELRINYLMNGQRLMNVLHYRLGTIGTQTDGPAFLNTLLTDFTKAGGIMVGMLGAISDQCQVDTIQAQKVYSDRWAAVEREVGASGVISSETDRPLPQYCAVSINRVVSQSKKGGKSHIAMPGITDSANDSGNVSLDWRAAHAIVLERLQENLSSLGIADAAVPVVWRAGQSGSTAPVVTSCTWGTALRCLQRRVVGRGV